MLFQFGAAVGNFSYSSVTGFLFDRYGVVTLMYILMQYSLTMLVLFAIMQVVVRVFGNRSSPDVDRNDDGRASPNTLFLNDLDDSKDVNLKYSDSQIHPLEA